MDVRSYDHVDEV